MSRFYGMMRGDQKKPKTTPGAREIAAHVCGWDAGIFIHAHVDANGDDVFEVFSTGGSNDPESVRILCRIHKHDVSFG